MKSFKQFISESVTIQGDFNGTLNVGYDPVQQKVDEQNQYIADVMWMGSIYRMTLEKKESIRLPSTQELAEQLQGEYPGAVVHNIYPVSSSSLNIKSSQRYRPERLSWSD